MDWLKILSRDPPGFMVKTMGFLRCSACSLQSPPAETQCRILRACWKLVLLTEENMPIHLDRFSGPYTGIQHPARDGRWWEYDWILDDFVIFYMISWDGIATIRACFGRIHSSWGGCWMPFLNFRKREHAKLQISPKLLRFSPTVSHHWAAPQTSDIMWDVQECHGRLPANRWRASAAYVGTWPWVLGLSFLQKDTWSKGLITGCKPA